MSVGGLRQMPDMSPKLATFIASKVLPPEDSTVIEPEVRLARRVVLRAVLDAVGVGLTCSPSGRAQVIGKGKAFMNNSAELTIWTSVARWDVHYILRKYKELSNSPLDLKQEVLYGLW